jgi:hypothetical protein
MTTPTVTEITRPLEPVARDTFVDSPNVGATLLAWPSVRRIRAVPRNLEGRGSRPGSGGSAADRLSAPPVSSDDPITRPRAA